ncbi:MAG: hypothetical protein ACM3WV_11120, partial [Bacillota bacterium]
MTKTIKILVLMTVILLLMVGFYRQEPVVKADQIILNPVADTDSQSDVAAGTNPTLNASQWCHIFVKFDLSSISGNITAATFRINHPGHSSNHTLYLNNASPDSWFEGGSKPTTGTNITSQSVTSTGYKQFTVTSNVQTEAAGDDLITFSLTTNLGTWESYNARESSYKPELIVTYEPVGSTPTNTPTNTPTATIVNTPTNTPTPTPTPTQSSQPGTVTAK